MLRIVKIEDTRTEGLWEIVATFVASVAFYWRRRGVSVDRIDC